MNYLKKEDRVIDIRKLPAKLRKDLSKHAVWDILKDQAKEEIKAAQIDLNKYIKQFLASLEAETTKKTYKTAINEFLLFLKKIGITSLLLVRAENIDDYLLELKGKYKNNTIRLKLAAVSSLYSRLKRYGHISNNPVYRVNLPKKEYKKAVKDTGETIPIMNDKEYQEIFLHAPKIIKLPIHLMATYGLRVGALETIKIKDNYFTYKTKGNKSGNKKLNLSTIKLLKKFNKTIKANTVKVTLNRYVKKLYKQEFIRHLYSCHDFRHYYAVRHYREHRDMVLLKNELDHASINITDVYLQSLKIK